MPRISVVGVVLTLALALPSTALASPLLTLRQDGAAFTREDPYLPPAGATAEPRLPGGRAATPTSTRGRAAGGAVVRAAKARKKTKKKRTVGSELKRLRKAGAIDQATYSARLKTYVAARRLQRKLKGARRAALGGVLRNLDQVAARGDLVSSRVPALFETVARNREWWSRGPLLRYGQRVSFQGSPLVWQYYTGEGLQIQWLGTFGKANALWKSRTHDDELRELLDAALQLAADRAGGIGFEYLFDFDGGRPPWVSGLAQGTAVQALSRAAVRLKQPRYFESARAGLGVFRTAPPAGVRISTPIGAHYLIYSFAPKLRVLNAFTQALNGLHDFALIANDAEGKALFSAGEAQLRNELPRYDTGAWSRYSLHREADLSYHKLAREFLSNLCTRLRQDAERAGSAPTTGSSPAVAPAPTAGSSPSGGAAAAQLAPTPAPALADSAPYCAAAERFVTYLKRRPVVKLLSRRVRAGKAASLRLTLSKPAHVKLAVMRGKRTITVVRARLGGGRRSLSWKRPRMGKGYRVLLRATDLAGNVGSGRGDVRVLKARKRRG